MFALHHSTRKVPAGLAGIGPPPAYKLPSSTGRLLWGLSHSLLSSKPNKPNTLNLGEVLQPCDHLCGLHLVVNCQLSPKHKTSQNVQNQDEIENQPLCLTTAIVSCQFFLIARLTAMW